MSLRTRVRGYTAWVNLRLQPYNSLLSNVLMDLLTGTNVKNLCQSLCGSVPKRVETFDGLSDQQKVTRIEWVVDELKKCNVIPADIHIDARLFATRSAEHVFELLWRLVCHDIWFVWERLEFLQHDKDDILSEVPFKWIPEPPPIKKAKPMQSQSLLSGFGASSLVAVDENDEADYSGYDPYPKSDFMKKFKGKKIKPGHYPPPDECILEMINTQLMSISEGQKLCIKSLDDLADSRVLCALVNSFQSNTFATEVLLNDRWTINLALRTLETMFYIESPFDSEDLVEADPKTVCAFFCAIFMVAFKYRQTKAVVKWYDHLKSESEKLKRTLDRFARIVTNLNELGQKKQIKTDLENIKIQMDRLEKRYDLDFCFKWIEHSSDVVKLMQKAVRKKMKDKFETMTIPRPISINDLTLALAINLNLTNGAGFYLLKEKESVTHHRKIVIHDNLTGLYYENWSSRKVQDQVRKMLKLPASDQVDLSPDAYPRYEIYVEAMSRNKSLKIRTIFMYQVFPLSFGLWTKVLFKAVRDNEIETVARMTVFFHNEGTFINAKEQGSLNSPLHVACKSGNFDIALLLLEAGANIDQKNGAKQTSIYIAIEGGHKELCLLLIEWGCDIHIKGPRGLTPFETIRSDDLRDALITAYEFYSTIVPRIIDGDQDALFQVVEDHANGVRCFRSLRSRCLNGSTLLHTAAYFGSLTILKMILSLGVDINLLDYKGATALHRAKDIQTMQVLTEQGVKINVEDSEGNTPLHVKCYGESNSLSQLDVIQMLLHSGANFSMRNSKGLMAIHCAAMQGRFDVIQILLQEDKDGVMKKALESEGVSPPSLPYLALAHDFIECAGYLLTNSFPFKENEQDLLLQRILSEQLKPEHRDDVVHFLLETGANANPNFPGSNSALHYAAAMSGPTDVLEALIQHGAELDSVNDDGASALFFACQSNNQQAAAVLLNSGANVRLKNLQGLTAFDFIMDYDEWIESGYFSEEIKARLKAYSLKHTRDLIRAISKKVKGSSAYHSQQQSSIIRQGVHQGSWPNQKTSGSNFQALPAITR